MAYHDKGTDNKHKHHREHHDTDTHSDMHHPHQNHEKHSDDDPEHHHHGDMVTEFKKRFYISLIVTIPILILSPMIQDFIGVDWQVPYNPYILFGLATLIFFYGGWHLLLVDCRI